MNLFTYLYVSVLSQRVCMICLDFFLFHLNLAPQTRHELKWFSRNSSLTVCLPGLISFMTTDDLKVVDKRKIGWFCLGRYSSCPVDVLVSLSQENWVCAVSYCLIASAAELTSASMHSTNSIIMTLMIFSISSGLLTR